MGGKEDGRRGGCIYDMHSEQERVGHSLAFLSPPKNPPFWKASCHENLMWICVYVWYNNSSYQERRR